MKSNGLLIAAALVVAIGALAACDPAGKATDEAPKPQPAEKTPAAPMTAADYAYRNSVNNPPPGWSGPVFELSHNYPASDPGTCPPDVCGWLGKPVNFDSTDYAPVWDDYMRAILDYVRDGQTLDPDGWNVDVGGETRWYHVPWMAFDTHSGREFIHGFTNERTAKTSDLLGPSHSLPTVPGNNDQFETWAFGIYNPWGGYAFQQSWDKDGNPITAGNCETPPFDGCRVGGLPFPEGTLVAKLLFTTATPDKVGYLEGSPTWMANRHTTVGGCERAPQEVRLVQMDVAVVDERSPSRWVYGTYGYNGTIQSGDPWERLSPLGVQWGSDPAVFPAVADKDATTISETALAQINIYEHFGCEGRLAGPVDNKLASCMSCHGAGFAALPVGSDTTIGKTIPPIYGYPGICTEYNADNAAYFANTQFPDRWKTFPDTMSMDTSLQLLVSFSSYGVFKKQGGPSACSTPTAAQTAELGFRGAIASMTATETGAAAGVAQEKRP